MKKIMMSLSIIIIFIFSLSACSNTSDNKVPLSIAVVLGNHANSKGINFANPSLSKAIDEAISTYGRVTVISDDGNPSVKFAASYDIPDQYKNASQEKLNSDASIKASAFLSKLGKIKADDKEVDTLQSLNLAVRSLSSTTTNSKKVIIVVDSGLSTSGIINFRNNLLCGDPESIAEQLYASKNIPDFKNIDVIWFQLGDVGAPQQTLSSSQREKLKAIWEAIIKKGGGSVEFSNELPSSDDIPTGQYPSVSTVPLASDLQISFNPSQATVFTEKQIQFIGNTAEYVNKESATQVLKPIAEYMNANPNFTALLAGTTATGNKDFCSKLSLDRANAVGTTLISLGVCSKQIRTVGLGCDDPWHISDLSADGSYIETYASQNRKVVLLDASSTEAKAILQKQ